MRSRRFFCFLGLAIGISGCNYVPLMRFDDSARGGEVGGYWTRNPNVDPNRPRDIPEEELRERSEYRRR